MAGFICIFLCFTWDFVRIGLELEIGYSVYLLQILDLSDWKADLIICSLFFTLPWLFSVFDFLRMGVYDLSLHCKG
ncbi:hypothetical protein FPQ18DRAFT_97732 [Pyronema domesticum]|nr:hypothetical protein FPQ18DRAFT_97732 [Pyronema domesticum]